MSVICNVIIPQIDPRVQEDINKLKSKMQEIQNSETMKQARDMAEQCFANLDYSIGHSELLKLANTVVDKIHEIKGYSEMIEQSKAFNEQIKTMLTLTLVKVKKSVINIYKKIVSCSRTPRSNNRTSSFSKSTQGDSGDSDQPDPPSPPGLAYLLTPSYLISRTPKKNRYSSSWQSAPNYCSMFGGGRA